MTENLFFFREVFTLMDAMKVDMANFQLQAIKPHLVQQSIEYERNKFKDYLQSNPGTFFNQGHSSSSILHY